MKIRRRILDFNSTLITYIFYWIFVFKLDKLGISMKVALTADRDWDGVMWDIEDQPRGGSIVADIPLPAEVEYSLVASRKAFGDGVTLPLAHIDSGDHGVDSGLVFWGNLYNSVCFRNSGPEEDLNAQVWGVRTRISTGPTNGQRGAVWDGTKSRIHLSVMAGRLANVEAYDFDGNRGNLLSRPNVGMKARKEEIVLSMRWLDGKFDDWNDFKLWKKEVASQALDHKQFNEKRTAHYKISTSDENQLGGLGEKFTKVIGARRAILPEPEKFAYFAKRHPIMKPNQWARALGWYGDSSRPTPDYVKGIGYAPVLKVLSAFGDVRERDAKQIPNMTPQQGAEYMFTKVLPAMMSFARAA